MTISGNVNAEYLLFNTANSTQTKSTNEMTANELRKGIRKSNNPEEILEYRERLSEIQNAKKAPLKDVDPTNFEQQMLRIQENKFNLYEQQQNIMGNIFSAKESSTGYSSWMAENILPGEDKSLGGNILRFIGILGAGFGLYKFQEHEQEKRYEKFNNNFNCDFMW